MMFGFMKCEKHCDVCCIFWYCGKSILRTLSCIIIQSIPHNVGNLNLNFIDYLIFKKQSNSTYS